MRVENRFTHDDIELILDHPGAADVVAEIKSDEDRESLRAFLNASDHCQALVYCHYEVSGAYELLDDKCAEVDFTDFDDFYNYIFCEYGPAGSEMLMRVFEADADAMWSIFKFLRWEDDELEVVA